MIAHHQSSQADVTLLVADRQTSRYLLFDNSMQMKGWTDIRSGEIRSPWNSEEIAGCRNLAFGGVHIVNPSVFPFLAKFSNDPKFSITPFYTSSCKDLRICGFMPDESYNWIDIGKPDALKAAQNIV